jgi:hypothetical protein
MAMRCRAPIGCVVARRPPWSVVVDRSVRDGVPVDGRHRPGSGRPCPGRSARAARASRPRGGWRGLRRGAGAPRKAAGAAGYAAVRRAGLAMPERFPADRLRLMPRWRVDVSKGLCVDAGLSCTPHQSVLLYLDSCTLQEDSLQIRPDANTSGGRLPDNPSARNDPSSTLRLSTMPPCPSRDDVAFPGVFGMKGHNL